MDSVFVFVTTVCSHTLWHTLRHRTHVWTEYTSSFPQVPHGFASGVPPPYSFPFLLVFVLTLLLFCDFKTQYKLCADVCINVCAANYQCVCECTHMYVHFWGEVPSFSFACFAQNAISLKLT